VSGQDAREAALARTRAHVAPHRVDVWDAFGTQIVLGRREGYRMWDLDGHELLDFHLNGGTFNLGHRNPDVIAALVGALDEVDIGNHHFASADRGLLAERLAATAPGLDHVVFASGGSEAIDIAIKSARHATGRRRIVGLDAGYHGKTGLSGAAGADAGARFFHSDLPADFATVPFADLDAMEAAVAAAPTAAVIMETVPATYGFPVVPEGYLAGVKAICERHGALYIADEVQTGLGRTGPLWAIHGHGVEPDLLVSGKGLSGGVYPIAAVLLGDAASRWLHEYGWGHVSTFGGSEVGCRVAAKVLEITTRPEVEAGVARLIDRYREGLAAIAAAQPFLVEVRRSGLVIGLRVDHPDGAIFLQQELHALGLWAIASGYDQSVLQFKPGLLLADDEVDRSLELLVAGLSRAREIDRPVPSRHPRPRTNAG
jgi:acetylornithine/succinyldiaminopimelate/putrescine aminotransferase